MLYETYRNMIKTKTSKPTESELEILSILWDRKNASVRTVHEELSKTKDAGYTTTLKLMQIMFEKETGYPQRQQQNAYICAGRYQGKNTESIPEQDHRRTLQDLQQNWCCRRWVTTIPVMNLIKYGN